MRILLFGLLLFPAALPAQSTADTFGAVVLAARSEAPSAVSITGTYEAEETTLRIARSGRSLVLTLAGQPAFDVFADAPADPTLNTRSELLLRGVFGGSTDRLADALPAHRREAGARVFARLLAALSARRGDVQSVQALGTKADPDGAATYVRVRYTEGEELLKLRWRDGHLAFITRGALPQITAYAVRGATHLFIVLNDGGEPVTLLVFGDEQVTARGADRTLVAARSF
jgi:hypothetical protein